MVEFAEKLQIMPIQSVAFHFQRQDFQKWLKNTIGDEELAKRIDEIKAGSQDENIFIREGMFRGIVVIRQCGFEPFWKALSSSVRSLKKPRYKYLQHNIALYGAILSALQFFLLERVCYLFSWKVTYEGSAR